ncbi:autophagy-related protein 13a-like [Curcuma longa]|uniref:autophagy-related protein 13a-like n=1 Tax=Curcuma longa TaxID=136217 RepID=UPI003D9EFE7D
MASTSESETDVTLFLRETLHAVLSSRIPRLRPGPRPSADRRFLLDLGDLPAPIEHHGSFSDPLVVDILLTPRGEDAEPGACETVVERWTGQCVPWNAAVPSQPRYGSSQPLSSSSSVILLRSVFALLRLLPAHRIFCLLCSFGQRCNYDLGYRVSSFAAPFSRAEEANLKRYSFAPADTLSGQLTVSVQYRPSLIGFNLVSAYHTPPMIIDDYIGSPAADPIRPFPASLPDWASLPNTSRHSSRVIRPLAAATPQCDRPHSWNTAPMAHHPLNPTQDRVGELGPSPSEHYFRPMPNFDDIRVSLPSPSPPTLGGHCLQSRLHMETAQMSIPSDTIKSLLAPLSPGSARPSQESPSKSTSLRTSEGKSARDIYSNLHMHAVNKGLKDGRDDSRRYSALPYGGSPRHGSSRSSRRFSMQDDPDDTDLSYPFAVNNDDTPDSQTRSSDVKEAECSSSHKSHQASVGILVHMLKTAPPLRQDQSYAPQSSPLTGEVSLSSSVLTRKTSDALEELQSYQHIKNFLLSKSEATAKLEDSLKQKEQ